MSNLILRLYVAAQNQKAAAREEGFVTAEHLAIAVFGVVVVVGITTVFQDQLENWVGNLFKNFENIGRTSN